MQDKGQTVTIDGAQVAGPWQALRGGISVIRAVVSRPQDYVDAEVVTNAYPGQGYFNPMPDLTPAQRDYLVSETRKRFGHLCRTR